MPILNELNIKYPHLNKVKQVAQELGDISPYMLFNIYSNWDKYDYLKDTEMLFLSLFILSQTDEQIQKQKSYIEALRPIEDKLKEKSETSNKVIK